MEQKLSQTCGLGARTFSSLPSSSSLQCPDLKPQALHYWLRLKEKPLGTWPGADVWH